MEYSNPLPDFKSSPTQAIQAVFASPNWVANVMWLTLGALTSGLFIGQIGIFGYGAELLERRSGRPENPPVDIDSNRLGDYITKGIWPFVAYFVAQLVMSFLLMIPFGLIFFLVAIAGAAGGDAAAALMMIIMVPLSIIFAVVLNVACVPFLLRAMVVQDFAASFDFQWVRGFVRIMFWEIVISSIVFYILAFGIGLAGLALCVVGYLPAIGVIMGGLMNLMAQWYEIYLSRGGEPAPSPHDIIDATIV